MGALCVDTLGPLRVKSLLRLVSSALVVKLFHTFKVETRCLLVQTRDMMAMELFFPGWKYSVPVTHAPGSERLARGTGAAAVQAGISAEGCSSSPSANWPDPGLVTVRRPWDASPIRWTEVPRHVVKDARQIPSTPPHTVSTPSSSSSPPIHYTFIGDFYISLSNNQDLIIHTPSPWPLPVRTHWQTTFHVSRTDNAQRRSAQSSPIC